MLYYNYNQGGNLVFERETRIYDTMMIELGPKVMDSWDAWLPAVASNGAIKVATRAGIAETLEAHRRRYGTSGGGTPRIQSSYRTDFPSNGQRYNGRYNRIPSLPRPSRR